MVCCATATWLCIIFLQCCAQYHALVTAMGITYVMHMHVQPCVWLGTWPLWERHIHKLLQGSGDAACLLCMLCLKCRNTCQSDVFNSNSRVCGTGRHIARSPGGVSAVCTQSICMLHALSCCRAAQSCSMMCAAGITFHVICDAK
jgi:hypothetical protein